MAEFSVNNSNNKFTLKLTLTERPLTDANISSNKNLVDYSLDLIANTSTHFSQYTIGHNLSLDNKVVSSASRSTKYSIGSYGTLNLASGAVEIEHDADGSKKMPIAFSIDMDSVSYTPRTTFSNWNNDINNNSKSIKH